MPDTQGPSGAQLGPITCWPRNTLDSVSAVGWRQWCFETGIPVAKCQNQGVPSIGQSGKVLQHALLHTMSLMMSTLEKHIAIACCSYMY